MNYGQMLDHISIRSISISSWSLTSIEYIDTLTFFRHVRWQNMPKKTDKFWLESTNGIQMNIVCITIESSIVLLFPTTVAFLYMYFQANVLLRLILSSKHEAYSMQNYSLSIEVRIHLCRYNDIKLVWTVKKNSLETASFCRFAIVFFPSKVHWELKA